MFQFLHDLFAFRAKLNEERQEKAEKALIAKVFNDRYTFRRPYRKGDVRRVFKPAEDLDDWFPDQAWMCPTCNMIHMTIGRSTWTGMHFPQCCTYPEGHRHYEKIKAP